MGGEWLGGWILCDLSADFLALCSFGQLDSVATLSIFIIYTLSKLVRMEWTIYINCMEGLLHWWPTINTLQ